jgi:uncharacterized protein
VVGRQELGGWSTVPNPRQLARVKRALRKVPGGVSRNIVDGIRRLSPQTVPAPDAQVGADGILAVDVELFPTAYRVPAGHRIRVQVSGGAFPRFARNFGTPAPFGAATRARRCRFEIHDGPQHPACVLLPVLPYH